MTAKRPFNLNTCARPNILALHPYTSTRDDYAAEDHVTLLDANENAFGPCVAQSMAAPSCGQGVTIQSALDPEAMRLNQYPDAQQTELKQLFCNLQNKRQDGPAKSLKPENICLGVGSDESIDGIIRAFCTPGRDKILICPPTYGMYSVSADVNDVGTVKVNLDIENEFALRPEAINDTLSSDPSIKVVFLCSPGNPAGNLLSRTDIIQVLDHPSWNGVVVVDEAYIDFTSVPSLAGEVNDLPNLIVTQTLSKAFGLAAIRLGVSFASLPVSRLLNNVKGPYNMSAPTIALATAALQPDSLARVEKNIAQMVQQRDRMVEELPKIPGFGRFLGGFDTNFLLVQFLDRPADQGGVPDNGIASTLLHTFAAKANILLRYRGEEAGCVGSLRITVGTKEEVDALLKLLRSTLEEAFASKNSTL